MRCSDAYVLKPDEAGAKLRTYLQARIACGEVRIQHVVIGVDGDALREAIYCLVVVFGCEGRITLGLELVYQHPW